MLFPEREWGEGAVLQVINKSKIHKESGTQLFLRHISIYKMLLT
jgi:hypothetical protein